MRVRRDPAGQPLEVEPDAAWRSSRARAGARRRVPPTRAGRRRRQHVVGGVPGVEQAAHQHERERGHRRREEAAGGAARRHRAARRSPRARPGMAVARPGGPDPVAGLGAPTDRARARRVGRRTSRAATARRSEDATLPAPLRRARAARSAAAPDDAGVGERGERRARPARGSASSTGPRRARPLLVRDGEAQEHATRIGPPRPTRRAARPRRTVPPSSSSG